LKYEYNLGLLSYVTNVKICGFCTDCAVLVCVYSCVLTVEAAAFVTCSLAFAAHLRFLR